MWKWYWFQLPFVKSPMNYCLLGLWHPINLKSATGLIAVWIRLFDMPMCCVGCEWGFLKVFWKNECPWLNSIESFQGYGYPYLDIIIVMWTICLIILINDATFSDKCGKMRPPWMTLTFDERCLKSDAHLS